MSIPKKVVMFIVGALVSLLAVDLWGMALLYRHNALIRIVTVADLAAVHPHETLPGQTALLEQFKGDDPVEIMQKVMNAVQRTEVYDSHNLGDIAEHVNHGGGLGCSGMAALYSGALSANGFENRRVVLLRNLYGVYDAHTIVEVFENQRWVIYDPTFNISFTKNGQKIGAREISQSFYHDSGKDIQVIHYGEVAYPARLETYYMNWQPLYNNVFVLENADTGAFEKIPPFRYWLGPTYIMQPMRDSDNGQTQWFQFQQELYFVFMVMLPVLVIILGVILFVILVTWAIQKKPRSE